MTEGKLPLSDADAAMADAGYYNTHSAIQGASTTLAIEALREAAESVSVATTGAPLVVADYGCAQGWNSLPMMTAAIEILRVRAPDRPVVVVHVDRPSNDFARLFTVLGQSPESYLRRTAGSYGLAVGRSFYEQVLPSGFVHLGWSAHAVNWLSRPVASTATSLWSLFLRGAAAEAVATQAADDWRLFLGHRARELVPGGTLVIVTSLRDQDGLIGAEGLMRLADRVLAELVDDGALQQVERDRMLLPTYHRTAVEFVAPFRDAFGTTLMLEDLRELRQTDPLIAAFERSADAAAFGRDLAGFLRGLSESFLRACLDERRDPVSSDALIERFFARIAEQGARSPDDYRSELRIALLKIRRSEAALTSQGRSTS
jgi:hypothetical protein